MSDLEKLPPVAKIFIDFGGRMWTVLFRSTKYCEHISRCWPQTISTLTTCRNSSIISDCVTSSRYIKMSHHVACHMWLRVQCNMIMRNANADRAPSPSLQTEHADFIALNFSLRAAVTCLDFSSNKKTS